MTQPIKPTPANLEKQIADEEAAIATCRTRRGEAITAGRSNEADDWTREIDRRRSVIEGLQDAMRGISEAAADAERASADKSAAGQRKRLERKVRDVRRLLSTVDDAADALIAADRAAREAIEQLYNVADGPTRAGELGELPRLVSTMASIVNERLAHGGVLQSRSIAYDASGPAPSVQQHFEGAVLTPIALPAGRPKKPGTDAAVVAAPALQDSDIGGDAVDLDEAAARAAIEKDIAA